jgi:hypothetical protein
MKVRIFASGEVKHIENTLGSVLVSAGLAEVTDAPVTFTPLPKPGDFKVPEPKWLVDLHPRAAVHIIQMSILGQFHYYSGPPEDANRCEKWNGQQRWFNGFNRAIPALILEEYTRRWKSDPGHRDLPKYVNAGQPENPNAEQAKEQKRYDDAVRDGYVPFSGGGSSRVIG